MKKTTKYILGLILVILIIVGTLFYIVNKEYKNKEYLEEVKSLITIQDEIEEKFTTEGYTIDKPNIIINPYNNAPLTALILFETEEKTKISVTIEGKDVNTTYIHNFKETQEHYLPIYGLYPDKENEIIISYSSNNKIESKSIIIKTDKLPEDFILPTEVYADKTNLNNDLYFFSPSSKGYTCAYDVNGDVRWYLSNNALWDINRLKNGHLLVSTERRINSPYYMTGLYEIDLLGKIYNEFSLPGGYHHDFFELESGNLLVASDDFNNASGTVEDYIVELDRKSGKVVKTFDLKDILNMKNTGNQNYSEYDWFHNNSVWYDDKTNSITLSGRHQDAVINIDYKTGKLNWIIGDSTNWDKEYQKYFFTPLGDNFEWQWSQHAAMITPDGYVFILDNGNNKSKIESEYVDANDSYTRGVMYKIDTNNMTIEQVWEYGKERGNDFYSPYISDVDYIGKNHYIVHSGGIVQNDGKSLNQPAGFGGSNTLISDTVELLNDKIIYEIKLPTNNYRMEKMSLYSNDTYEIKDANKLGNLGKTKVDKSSMGTIHNILSIDNNYNSHNISFTKEEDRLVFTGQFKKGTDVKIILYSNLTSKYYNVPISKKPYTALCIDIFTDEENENGIVVTKYINEKGLYGNYSIYIEIDGKIYNTEKSVKF